MNGRRHPVWPWLTAVLLVALIPRMWLALEFPSALGDSGVYQTVADNIRINGCVSLSAPARGECVAHAGGNQPPGYPTFIAVTQAGFGRTDLSVTLAQAIIGSLAIVYAAGLLVGVLGAAIGVSTGFVLALSFVSLAWPRLVLTESLSVSIAILLLALTLRLRHNGQLMTACLAGLLLSAAFMVRYDGAILAIPVAALLIVGRPPAAALRDLVVLGIVAAIPVTAWSVRSVLHGLPVASVEFQLEDGWRVPAGYIAWKNTWSTDQFDNPHVLWPLATGSYRAIRIPEAAYHSVDDRSAVEALLEDLRQHEGKEVPAEIDTRFAKLAAARKAEASPIHKFGLPLRRAVHMWITPFFSSGWPVQVDRETRERSGSTGGLIEVAIANPLSTLVKGTATAYRVAVIAGFFAVLLLCFRRLQPLVRALLVAAASYAIVRTGAFSILGFTETRYLAPVFPWLEVGLSAALVTVLLSMRAQRSG